VFVCLFVSLFVCLFACLFVIKWAVHCKPRGSFDVGEMVRKSEQRTNSGLENQKGGREASFIYKEAWEWEDSLEQHI